MKTILQELNENSSTNYKLDVLKKHKDNQDFKKVLYYTYNQDFNYYIKKIPSYINNDLDISYFNIKDMFDTLDMLRTRTVTGNKAIDLLELTLTRLPKDLAYVLELIIGQDLKCNISTKSINKVFKDLIPVTPYMGAIIYDNKKALDIFKKYGMAYAEIKEDGRFANLIIKDDVSLVSRNGKPTYIFGKLYNELFRVKEFTHSDTVLTGELLVNGYNRLQGNGIILAISTINEKILFSEDSYKDEQKFLKTYGVDYKTLQDQIYAKVWDIIPYEFYLKGEFKVQRAERLQKLETLLNNIDSDSLVLINYKVVYSLDQAKKFFKETLQQGLEGLILKSPAQTFVSGKPNGQIKMKIEVELDLRIIGFKMGNIGSKYENTLGAIHCSTELGEMTVYVSGISDSLRDQIWNNKESYLSKIAVVKCNGLSINKDNGINLFFPNLVEIRDDKDCANTLEECIQIEKSIIGD